MTLGKDLLEKGMSTDARGLTIDPGAPYVQVDGSWYRAGMEPRKKK